MTYHERAAAKGAVGRQVLDWRHALEKEWPALRFGEIKVETGAQQHVFEVQVYLNGLDPNAVRVELYADGVGSDTRGDARGDTAGDAPARLEMERVGPLAGVSGAISWLRLSRTVLRRFPAADYTVRVIPRFTGVAVPLEAAQILWQR